MKKATLMLGFVLVILGGSLTHPVSSIASLYDDFKGPGIDPKKWTAYEFVREIQNGKLVSRTAAYASRVTNSLNFKDPVSISYIEADVAVSSIEGDLGSSGIQNYSSPNARITGFFYNDGSASGPGSYKGEVQGAIRIAPYNGQFWVYWNIWKSADDQGTNWPTLAWGSFPNPVSLNTTYKLSIQFDPNSKTFTFNKPGETPISWTSTDTIHPSNIPWKVIGTDIFFTGTGTALSGKISATFDNVTAKDGSGNVVMNDDFSSPAIDPNKWDTYELVRDIENGQFISELRSVNGDLQNNLSFENPDQIDNFQAKAALINFDNPDGAITRARLGGYFYNDTGPGSGRIGDVWAEVSLGGTGSVPSVYWLVSRSNDSQARNVDDFGKGILSCFRKFRNGLRPFYWMGRIILHV